MIVRPHIKLNLGLRVLGKRPDGYHDLETVFLPCDAFGDVLEVEPSDEFSLDIDGPCYRGWDPSEDLCCKAWRLLHSECGAGPVRMHLSKRSPVGAGLGGGSADAAFALRALNEMFSLGLQDADLAAFAARLGSDCAFFIYDRPMFATGRGEILEPFDLDLSGYEIRVEVPEGVSVSTKEAYAGLEFGTGTASGRHATLGSVRGRGPSQMGGMRGAAPNRIGGCACSDTSSLRDVLRLPVRSWRDRLVNDFEASVFPLHPEIASLKQRFYDEGAAYAAMSGSGSAVFALFPANK